MERAFSPGGDHPLHRWIRGLTEYTFIQKLGMGDPGIVDYLSALLIRSVSTEAISQGADPFPSANLETLNVLEMIARQGATEIATEAFRRLGDRNLFLTGVFPESVNRRNARHNRDLRMLTLTGKRAYLVAAVLDRSQELLMHRLSERFEICAEGLRNVRQAWEDESANGSYQVFWGLPG